MSTIVFVHAHPDDESSQTAGMMSLASDAGHRVVVVYATGGEHGTRPEGLDPEASLADYRRGEAEASAAVTGTARVAWLGYHDSGMTGWTQNDDPRAFARADVGEAAGRLAAILDEEHADAVVGYDWHGLYGHPDHIAVHRVVREAAGRAASRPHLYEETVSRGYRHRLRDSGEVARLAEALGLPPESGDELWNRFTIGDDGIETGVDESEIAWEVVLPPEIIARKRRAMAAHASQTSDIGMMLALPEQVYAILFGREFLIDPADPAPMREGFPFA